MWKRILPTISALAFTGAVFGQTSFDAASIKPSPPPAAGPARFGPSGGPGTSDPGLYQCHSCTVSSLILEAWNIQPYQLILPNPDNQRYDVTARIATPATREQLRAMLQNLLEERFRLALHRETRDLPMYELTVAKAGPKLRDTKPGAEPDALPASALPIYAPDLKQDRDGFPILPAAASGRTLVLNGSARVQKRNQSAGDIALWLAAQTRKPVNDSTGLKGRYDFTLSWAVDPAMMRMPMGTASAPVPIPPDPDSGPTIFEALQQQLGLRLEPKKGPVVVFVVDHAEKAPSGN